MTNPFQTLVGLKTVADSGASVLVNDLPGISTELAGALTNGDNTNAAAVWAKVQRGALDKLRSLVETELSKSADFRYKLAETTVWEAKPVPLSYTGDVATPGLVGARFTVPYLRYRQLTVEGFFANIVGVGNVPVPVKVVDLSRGVLLKNVAVFRPAGLEPMTPLTALTLEIPLTGLDVFVGIDATGLTLTELGGAAKDLTGDSNSSMTCGTLFNATSLGTLFSKADTRVWPVAYVGYSLLSVISRYADRLLWAYANVAGSLLMAEKLGSSNMNLFTNTNRDFTEDREAKFMDEAVNQVKPIARDILKELAPTDAVTPATEQPFDVGYRTSGFV